MSYPKGKDAKIKNIEQLDNIENRGIEIIFKTDIPQTIEVEDGLLEHTPKLERNGFTKIKGFDRFD